MVEKKEFDPSSTSVDDNPHQYELKTLVRAHAAGSGANIIVEGALATDTHEDAEDTLSKLTSWSYLTFLIVMRHFMVHGIFSCASTVSEAVDW